MVETACRELDRPPPLGFIAPHERNVHCGLGRQPTFCLSNWRARFPTGNQAPIFDFRNWPERKRGAAAIATPPSPRGVREWSRDKLAYPRYLTRTCIVVYMFDDPFIATPNLCRVIRMSDEPSQSSPCHSPPQLCPSRISFLPYISQFRTGHHLLVFT